MWSWLSIFKLYEKLSILKFYILSIKYILNVPCIILYTDYPRNHADLKVFTVRDKGVNNVQVRMYS